MLVEKRSGRDERRILTGMIVDDMVLGRIAGKWERDLFRSKWANLVGGWCVKFHRQYGKAPRKAIEGLFETWAEQDKDRDTVKLVEKFLGGLSNEYRSLSKDSNSEFVIDTASKYFGKVRLEKLAERVQAGLDSGDLEAAQEVVDGYGRVNLSAADGIDVLLDKEALRQAFTKKGDPLIRWPGALGKFFGSRFERDGFISFMGPEKRGKSFWLLETAWRAMLQRRKVAFFEVGDMSQDQVLLRLASRWTGEPVEAGTIMYPVSLRIRKDSGARVRRKKKIFKKGLSWQKAYRVANEIIRTKLKTKESLLRLVCAPNDSIGVADIKSQVERWIVEGWIPDIIVIDYADLLAAPQGIKELRDQINKNWKGLRALSQEFHCLVVTASQSDTASYKARTMGRWNFSDDKRKLAHVTGMIGLNATEEEEDQGLIRLNWVVRREGKSIRGNCCTCAMCLDVCNPAVRSVI